MCEVPEMVQTLLKEYIELFNHHFPGTLEGVYLHGSLALNAYVNDSSDIDFMTLTNHRLKEDDLELLSTIHETIAGKYLKPEMDGVYIVMEDIGKLYYDGLPIHNHYPYYNGGKLSFGNYFNFNPITWWLLKTKGINIWGPHLHYGFDIGQEQLLSYVHENMNTYWIERIRKLEYEAYELLKQPEEYINAEIEWTVLGLLRQYYTLREGDIISKQDAGYYGLQHTPDKWHDIIREAVNIRNSKRVKLFSSNKERIDVMISFSNFLIDFCNSNMA